ncbi:MAG: hypothetical protein IPL04_07380 [Chitinophagaceae bacterium]|nr:hypothetical protein [Chitinophagaceae bacterium]
MLSMDAQVTTSGIIGTVKGADGNWTSGASIKATHTPLVQFIQQPPLIQGHLTFRECDLAALIRLKFPS